MSNEKKLTRENTELKEQLEDARKPPEDYFQAYKCGKCGMTVSFMFIMPVIKASGLCPNCFHE